MATREQRLEAALRDALGDTRDFCAIEDNMVRCRHCGREYDADDAPESVLDCSEDCPGRIGRGLLNEKAA